MATSDFEPPPLIDPVCGVAITAASPHLSIHDGAMFYFCGHPCHKQFESAPSRFARVVLLVPSAPEVASSPFDDWDLTSPPEHAELPAVAPAPMPNKPERRVPGGLRGLFMSKLFAWREGCHVARTSGQLLALYWSISARNPKLSHRELYQRVVMERAHCDEAAANVVLKRAAESFASWPVMRELTLCDVVHYLSVTEFLAQHDGEHWMRSDVRAVVNARIPHKLCVVRKGD